MLRRVIIFYVLTPFVIAAVLWFSMPAAACSGQVSTGSVVNRLRGNIKRNGKPEVGATVELQRVTKRGEEHLRTVALSEKGDFDLGDLPTGNFRLVLLVANQKLILPIIVTHVQRSGTFPTTFLDADLHSPIGTDCNIGHWTFDSYLVTNAEEAEEMESRAKK